MFLCEIDEMICILIRVSCYSQITIICKMFRVLQLVVLAASGAVDYPRAS